MKKLAVSLGAWGSGLGMLVGLVELGFGSHIRPWIGYKENPVILGLVTLLLSGLAWVTVWMAGKRPPQTAENHLATLLGLLLPAVVCFTTVGALWYLPGSLLLAAVGLLVVDFSRNRPTGPIHAWRWLGGLGALISLLAFTLGFYLPALGLFQLTVLVRADRLSLEIGPMDALRRTTFTFGAARLETVESLPVLMTYLLLVVGAAIALLACLGAARWWTRLGAGLGLAGAFFFLWQLPTILAQVNFQGNFDLWTALGWGWYLSWLGASLTLASTFWQAKTSPKLQPGKG